MSNTEGEDIIDLEEELKFISFDKELSDESMSVASTRRTFPSEEEDELHEPDADTVPQVRHFDSEYLQRHLGLPLTLALADIAMKCPADPIYYLAHWLLRWRSKQEHEQEQHDRMKELKVEKDRIHQQSLQARMLQAKESVEEEFYVDEFHLASLQNSSVVASETLSAQGVLLQAFDGNKTAMNNNAAQVTRDDSGQETSQPA